MDDGIFKERFEGSRVKEERRLRAVGGNNVPLCSCFYCALGLLLWTLIVKKSQKIGIQGPSVWNL